MLILTLPLRDCIDTLQSAETVCVNAVVLLVTMCATPKPYTHAKKLCENNMTLCDRAVIVFVNRVEVYINAWYTASVHELWA